MKSYKGFDKDLKCKGFQYDIGKEYECEDAVACRTGFHACERPLDVFAYYPPASSRYCEVEQGGKTDANSDDSKIASTKIKIGAEIGIPGLVKAQIEYVKAHTTTEHTDQEAATAGDMDAATAGYRGAATAGYMGAATAGNCGAATAGYMGAATAGNCGAATAGDMGAATAGNCGAATAGHMGAATAGYRGAATAGNCGAATAGDMGAATAGDMGAATAGDCGYALSGGCSSCGKKGVAVVRGSEPRAKGGLGAVLVIVKTDDDGEIETVKTVTVDDEKVKADTWYTIKGKRLVEVNE